MGISGLLPLLEKSSRRANVKEFSGQTVAIDAYCWLHRGAFSCADKLVMNEKTLEYVNFCMKFVNMLLSHGIKPILVFDGRHLPAKVETEKKRRETRAFNRKKGAELLRAGKVEEGRNYLRRSLDVTHEMALNLIKECRRRNIDCIVAPHEADAQLAYLNIKDIAQVVVTEDSDLLLFGCVKVLFKMDVNGNGILIEKDKLHVSMDMRHDNFTIDKFRYMCILSGCDYLPSLPGVGLKTALKFIHRMTDEDIDVALPKLPVYVDKRKLEVPSDYVASFVEADKTFKYQLVYDPIRRRQIPLSESGDEDVFVGHKLSEDVAFQLAIGNLDPMSMRQMDSYDPDKQRVQVTPHNKHAVATHPSIWSGNYSPRTPKLRNAFFPVHRSTKGITVTTSCSVAVKRQVEEGGELDVQSMKKSLLEKYSISSESETATTAATGIESDLKKHVETAPSTPHSPTSPILLTRKSVFSSFQSYSASNRSLASSESSNLLISRYFSSETPRNEPDPTPGVLDAFEKVGVDNRATEETPMKTRTKTPELGIRYDVEGDKDGNKDSDLGAEERIVDQFESVRRDLTKFVFLSQRRAESESGDSLAASSSSQTENISDEVASPRDGPVSLFDCRDSPKTVLSPVNRVSSLRESFYYSSEEASPYFDKSGDKCRDVRRSLPSSSPSPVKTHSRNAALMRSTKNSTAKTSRISKVSSSNPGKNQSLLTRFGFQQRPKLQTATTQPS